MLTKFYERDKRLFLLDHVDLERAMEQHRAFEEYLESIERKAKK